MVARGSEGGEAGVKTGGSEVGGYGSTKRTINLDCGTPQNRPVCRIVNDVDGK